MLTSSSRSLLYEPAHDETNKMTCAPSVDSDQPGHPSSLIRVFAVRLKKHWVLSYPLSAQQRLWSDWAEAQADLGLHWAHTSYCWFCRAANHIRNKPEWATCNWSQRSRIYNLHYDEVRGEFLKLVYWIPYNVHFMCSFSLLGSTSKQYYHYR